MKRAGLLLPVLAALSGAAGLLGGAHPGRTAATLLALAIAGALAAAPLLALIDDGGARKTPRL